jgi:uncharacterized protein (DUF3084 family)
MTEEKEEPLIVSNVTDGDLLRQQICQNSQKDKQLKEKDKQLEEKDKQLNVKDKQIRAFERQIELLQGQLFHSSRHCSPQETGNVDSASIL